MDALATVLQTLPSLSADSLREVKNKTQALLSLGGSAIQQETAKALDPVTDYIYDGICYELRRRGLLGKGYVSKDRLPKNFAQASKEVRSFLESFFKEPLLQPQLVLLGRLAAEALAEHLGTFMPIGPSALFKNVAEIPTALDHMLPDYLQSGLILFMLDRKFQ